MTAIEVGSHRRDRLLLLWVDDQPVLQDVGRLLRFEGADLDQAVTAAAGIQLEQSDLYDLILTDLKLLDRSGLDVA